MNRNALLILLLAAISPPGVSAQETNAPTGLDKQAFQVIVRKNIFDSTRTGRTTRRGRVRRAESFTFCGGGFDGPRAVATFSGTGAPPRVLKPGDIINGFKIDAIAFRSVKLKPADGPELTLALGKTLRREEGGPWKESDEPAAAAESPETLTSDSNANSNSEPSASPGAESDIIKRLRAKREEN